MLFAEYAWTQQSATERPAWNVQLGRNVQAKSTITIQNQCKRSHTFTIIEQQTPYIQIMGAATINVPGNSSSDLPVLFSTNGMNAGQYQGTVIVKCDTCGKEKGCTQDREILPVRLVVLEASGAQMTPGNPAPPQVPGPPVIGKPPGNKPVATTSAVKVKGYDPETDKEIGEREFADQQNPCPKQECGAIKKVTKEGASKGFLFCEKKEKCGGEKCPNSTCYVIWAWGKKDDAPKNTTDPEKWTRANVGFGIGEQGAFKPNAKKVYGCACY